MIVKTTTKEISPTSTSTKSREYECVITAVGDKNSVTDFQNFFVEYCKGYADGMRQAQAKILANMAANPNTKGEPK
jgi:hypothetical protein